MDIEKAKENLKEFKKKIKKVKIFEVSAIINDGLDIVMEKIADLLDTLPKEELYKDEKFESYVLYKFKKEEPYTIIKENDIWVIKGKEVEKLLQMTKFNTEEATIRFANKLRKLGIDKKLIELGIQEGDKVRILDYEFEFK